ncbi:MAG: hypothetical protein NWF00_01410 [Candidatus Bathyarchaeota archaeon]|nr:hypothetical protein [Candidatus Bathyarchaeota archaeon]
MAKIDLFSLILGALIALAMQSVYQYIFLSVTGQALETVVVGILTFLVFSLVIAVAFMYALLQKIKGNKKENKIVDKINKTTNEKIFQKEIELEKLHILKEDHHMHFKIGGSILVGGFTTLLVLILTLSASEKLNQYNSSLLIISLVGLTTFAFFFNDLMNNLFLKKYNDWLLKIEKCEPLPPIHEMKEKLNLKEFLKHS